MRPGRRFSDASPGCGLPAAWSGGDLGDLGVFRSLAALPLNPVFFTHPSGLGRSPLLCVSFLICKVGTVTEPKSESCEDAVR